MGHRHEHLDHIVLARPAEMAVEIAHSYDAGAALEAINPASQTSARVLPSSDPWNCHPCVGRYSAPLRWSYRRSTPVGAAFLAKLVHVRPAVSGESSRPPGSGAA